jgi:hypothetical protein
MSISVNAKIDIERIVVDGEKFKPLSVVAIASAHQEWFPHLRGRLGRLIARHFSGVFGIDLNNRHLNR